MQQIFSFKGRLGRFEYLISYFIFIFFITLFSYSDKNQTTSLLYFLIALPLYWFIFAQGSKRCHDSNYSGWFQLVPLFNLYLLFFKKGDITENSFGLNPKINNINADCNSEYYFNCGVKYYNISKFDKAVLNYLKAIELNPTDPDIYNNIAYSYLELKNYEFANKYFDQCLEIDGKYVDSYIGKSILYYNVQNYDEAIKALKKAIEVEPYLNSGINGIQVLSKLDLKYSKNNIMILKELFGRIDFLKEYK
jgi:tetratricopeptide (TPR) repeat protein